MSSPPNVLHPTDFSPTADRALSWALALAKPSGAGLRLLHAVETRRQHVDEAQARACLADRAERARALGVDVSCEVAAGVYAGPVVLAASRTADLVVVGRVGQRDASAAARRRRGGLGSVADELVRFAEARVLVVPADHEPAASRPGEPPALPTLRRVLVPVDFSPASRAALAAAAELARRHGAELDLLHVIERPPMPEIYELADPLASAMPAVEERVSAALGELAASLAPGVPVRVQVAYGRAAAEIEAWAAERAVDLVVIANRGLSLLARLWLGTTAEEVVRHCSVPVLVVRAVAG
jgi:nucleotide-binding universal stress UspA family protein